MMCTLTLLSMINWKYIERHEISNKAFKAFKTRLDRVMVSGYYEFVNKADEEAFLAEAAGYINMKLESFRQY